jgi:hypothetical protein
MTLGSYTQDKAALARVRRVALVRFTAQNYASPQGEDVEPMVMQAFDEFVKEFDKQAAVELVPLEEVVASPEYQAIQEIMLPEGMFSPVEGLTYLRGAVPTAAVAELAESLGADAVMRVHIDYDLDFPTWNAAHLKRKTNASVVVPPDGHVVWQEKGTTWEKELMPLGADFKRWIGSASPGVKAEAAQGTFERIAGIDYGRRDGGAVAFFFLADAKAARGD